MGDKPTNARDGYYEGLQRALKADGVYQPVLIVDLNRLNHNIDTMLGHLPAGMSYRIVAKSLPSPKLLAHIRARTGTNRLMTFNLPMLLDVAQAMPDADQMLGKPLPVAALKDFLARVPEPSAQNVSWLIDTPERLKAYDAASEETGQPIKIVLELDVGLHRGGFEIDDALHGTLSLLQRSNRLTFTGFMGYEPHIASIPKALKWRDQALQGAWDIYSQAVAMAESVMGAGAMDGLLRNAGGSPTYRLYRDTRVANEVSVGSALVKPTHFDTELLEPLQPACFIATPVLKAVGKTRMPATEFADSVGRTTPPESAQTFFIHGGNWLADLADPPNLSHNKGFGRSSNQEMLNAPADLDLGVDDFVFLRPHQSETVFFQFNDLVIFSDGKISDRWPTFPISA